MWDFNNCISITENIHSNLEFHKLVLTKKTNYSSLFKIKLHELNFWKIKKKTIIQLFKIENNLIFK